MAKLGLQLYTVKDELEKDFFGTIRRVAKLGYKGIEFPGGLMQSATAEEVKKVLDETELEVAGAVFGMEELENNLEEIIEYCRIIDCPAIIFPWLTDDYRTLEGYEQAAIKFNLFAERLKEYNIKYLYHIHGYEFDDLGGCTGLDILLKKTNPELVGLETDVYWVEWAGVDSEEFMKKYGHRSPYIHFKDMKDKQSKHDIEVGEGAIDMAAIAREGIKNNAEWFIVEQEAFDKPTMVSVAISLKNLKRIVAGKPEFTKVVIGEVKNDVPPAELNSFSSAGDINLDGFIDAVISGRNGKMIWLENKGSAEVWKEHLIDEVECMECGGSLVDLTGNGYPDIINGGDWRSDEIYWWENPGRVDVKWTKRLVAKTGGTQIHDTIIGDITGDGRKALIFTNQRQKGGTTIFYIPLPENPYISPWPDIQVIAEAKSEPNPYMPEGIQPEEGLAIGDLDGDGINELVAGTHWYKYNNGIWEAHKFAAGYITVKCAIGDIDGDGKNEIVLSEGDPCIYGKIQGGKLSWFKPDDDITAMWKEHIIEDFLFDAHSLQLGDICGNGKLDIFVGEVGKSNEEREYIERMPRLIVFENDGTGSFIRHVIDEGTGTHEALLVDTKNRGVLDILGKPLHGAEIWNIHVWYNRC